MRLALQVSEELAPAFAAAARRLRGVTVVPSDQAHDAIVTDDPAAGRAAAGAGRSVLLHHWQPDELRSVDQACRTAGVTLMPAHPWRFCPAVEALMLRHRGGRLGAPGLVRIHRWRSGSLTDVGPEAILPEIDLVQWIFGRSPEAVYAVRPEPAGAQFLQIHLGFAEGGMALVDHAWGLPGADGYDSLCLIGADGAAYADDHDDMSLLLADGPAQAMRTRGSARELEMMLRAFIRAIEPSDVEVITTAETLAALRTAETVLEAARTSTVRSPAAGSA